MLASFGADRLLLGTDFPYETGDTYVRAIDYVHEPKVDPKKAQAILETNTRDVLGITESAADGMDAQEPTGALVK